jgi:hypothetical protein
MRSGQARGDLRPGRGLDPGRHFRQRLLILIACFAVLAVSRAFPPAQMHGAAAANVVRLVPLAAVLIVGAVAPRRRLSEMAVQFGAPLVVLVATSTATASSGTIWAVASWARSRGTKGRTRDADSDGYRREQRRADQGRYSVSDSVWISCRARTASTPPNGTTRGAFVRIDRVVIGPISVGKCRRVGERRRSRRSAFRCRNGSVALKFATTH